jgi:hypothetical protein
VELHNGNVQQKKPFFRTAKKGGKNVCTISRIVKKGVIDMFNTRKRKGTELSITSTTSLGTELLLHHVATIKKTISQEIQKQLPGKFLRNNISNSNINY